MARPRTVFVCALLALVTLLVYLPVRHHAFVVCDDPDYVTQNPIVQAGLTWSGFQWAFSTLDASNWHPLTWLSHMLDCQLFGLNAGRHHLVSVLFHATNAVLLLLLMVRMTGAFWQSAFIAALFAWHPLHVESVAWVAERKDVLSTFFGLLTLMAYVRYAHGATGGMWQVTQTNSINPLVTRHASRYYRLALLFFALGLMAKPMLVTLPFVFLLLDYWPLGRVTGDGWQVTSDKKSVGKLSNFKSQLSTLLREKWPFFALAAASCVVTFVAQKRGESVAPLEAYPLSARIANAAVAYVKYLVNSVCPVNLAVIYPLPKEIPWVEVVGAIMVLAVITSVIWQARRRQPYWVTGWLWYLGMLVPVVGLVQVGRQAMADRYTYLPLIGVFIGMVFGLGDLAKKLRLNPTMMISVAGIVLAGCLFATARQLQYWQDSETLFERALAVTKNNPVAQNNLGSALLQKGNVDEAIVHFQKALQINPAYAEAHNNLGVALFKQGNVDEAISHFQMALQTKLDNAEACYNLGNALLQKGRVDEAISHYQKALQIKPDYVGAENNLAWVLAACPQASLRNGNKAVELALRANQLTGDGNPAVLHTLAAAYAETGRFPEAVATAQHALQVAGTQSNPALADAIRSQLRLYQAGIPFHLQ